MRRALARRLRDESGIALPVVTLILAMVLSLGAVAVSQALSASRVANRDVLSRKADQAAQAGLDAAAYRMNALSLDLSSLLDISKGGNPLQKQCVINTGSVLGISALSDLGSWCPISTPEALGNGSYFQYQISPLVKLSTGTQADHTQCYLVALLVPCGTLLAQTLYTVDGIVGLNFRREIVAIGKAGPDCASTVSGTDGPRCIKRRLYAAYVSDNNNAAVATQSSGLLALVTSTLQNLLLTPLSNGGDLDAQLKLYKREANSFRECTATAPTGSTTPAGGC